MAPSLQSSCLSFPNPGITGTLPFLTWWWMTVNVAGLSGTYLSNGHLGVPGEVSGAKWLRGRVPECGQHHPLGWDLDAKLRRGAHWIYIYSCSPISSPPFLAGCHAMNCSALSHNGLQNEESSPICNIQTNKVLGRKVHEGGDRPAQQLKTEMKENESQKSMWIHPRAEGLEVLC